MKVDSNENPMGSISAKAILDYDAERPSESKLDAETEADIKFFFHCMEDKIHFAPVDLRGLIRNDRERQCTSSSPAHASGLTAIDKAIAKHNAAIALAKNLRTATLHGPIPVASTMLLVEALLEIEKESES
jgi:hypothetical protein